jgi:hypothetical protein
LPSSGTTGTTSSSFLTRHNGTTSRAIAGPRLGGIRVISNDAAGSCTSPHMRGSSREDDSPVHKVSDPPCKTLSR